MNQTENLLTEQQSSEMAGVSLETIKMYANCGLLPVTKKDNINFFKEIDIKTLFYSQLKDKKETKVEPETTQVTEPQAQAAATEPQVEKKAEETKTAAAEVSNTTALEPTKEEPQQVTLNSIRADKYFPTTVELLEINKSLRDQIQILREERDWLRERIEKLESRSEREQMLMLSESENLRSMINLNKKSFLQKTLPWLYKD
ncbi:MAG: hypothetical protein KBC84_01915 [Proteobacteria bacterium]|nr:hypothetical protein [Pseudomonadota bacterium]